MVLVKLIAGLEKCMVYGRYTSILGFSDCTPCQTSVDYIYRTSTSSGKLCFAVLKSTKGLWKHIEK